MNINQYKTPIYDMNYSDQKNEFFIKRDDLLPFSFGGNKVRIAEQYFRDMKKRIVIVLLPMVAVDLIYAELSRI